MGILIKEELLDKVIGVRRRNDIGVYYHEEVMIVVYTYALQCGKSIEEK